MQINFCPGKRVNFFHIFQKYSASAVGLSNFFKLTIYQGAEVNDFEVQLGTAFFLFQF